MGHCYHCSCCVGMMPLVGKALIGSLVVLLTLLSLIIHLTNARRDALLPSVNVGQDEKCVL